MIKICICCQDNKLIRLANLVIMYYTELVKMSGRCRCHILNFRLKKTPPFCNYPTISYYKQFASLDIANIFFIKSNLFIYFFFLSTFLYNIFVRFYNSGHDF